MAPRRKKGKDSPPDPSRTEPAFTPKPVPPPPEVERAEGSYWSRRPRTKPTAAAPTSSSAPTAPAPPTAPTAPTPPVVLGVPTASAGSAAPAQLAFALAEDPTTAAPAKPTSDGAPRVTPPPREAERSSYWSRLARPLEPPGEGPRTPIDADTPPVPAPRVEAPKKDAKRVARAERNPAEDANPAEEAKRAEEAKQPEPKVAPVAPAPSAPTPAPVSTSPDGSPPASRRARRSRPPAPAKAPRRAAPRRPEEPVPVPAAASAPADATIVAGLAGEGAATSTLTLERPTEVEGPAQPRRPRSHKRRRRWSYRTLMISGALLIVAATTWQIEATLWTTHSERAGKALVNRFRNEQATLPSQGVAGAGALAACAAASSNDQVKGILVIPKLGVTAPVEEGVGDDQLNVAVGHLPGSVWPGTAGNAVLEAHDVSYFVNLAQLDVGDTVQFQSPCSTYVFKVQGHTVVQQGTPVYNTTGPTVTMVTCWPTNALWFTPQRYLVTAALVSTSTRSGTSGTFIPASPAPTVNVPAPLAAQGVTLATYSVPMGTMTVDGAGQAWLQSTNPLLVEDSAVEAFIAGVRSLSENRPDWWSAFAPSAPIPPALVGAKVSYKSSLDVQLTATGSTPLSATLTVAALVTGGSAPGTYTMTVSEAIQADQLTVTNWVLSPA